MTTNREEINRIEAEIQTIQDEIDRRHERIDGNVDVASNHEKIEGLRARRAKLAEKLQKLKN